MSVLTACVLIASMLALSAFFSGMEIAFSSSNRLRLEVERKGGGFFDYAAGLFTRRSGQYITTMLVGNNIVLVIYSLAVSALLNASVVVETLVAMVVIIFLGEYIPKSVVLKNPNFYLRAGAFPVWIFYVVLWPLTRLMTLISAGVIRLFGGRAGYEQVQFGREELVSLVEESREPEHEVKLFQRALDFPDLLVRDCMVQRINVEAVDVETPIATLRERFVETKYSRIFVWERSIDNIIGYVNVKSLFCGPGTVREAMQRVDYVPETMPAQELMRNLLRQRAWIAVVIDEFGGTAGVVSLEDILEEIFGEIEDEHDEAESVERQVGPSEWVLSSGLEVGYLNERYGLAIPESEEYDTLAGYVIFNCESIPPAGREVTIGRHEIRVLRGTSSRIELVKVRII